MSFFEDIRTGSVAVFFISLIYACSLCAASMDDGVRALNEGRLREACEIFSAVGKDQRELPLNRGIAYKNLGTALFRLGQSFQKAFDTSEKIFLELLQKKSTPEVKRQYAYLLYQRANCLLTACENQLSKAKMQGISSIPFDYLKNYLHPVSVTLKKIKTVYPEKQRGDLLLLELDLLLTEVHIWEACRQEGIAARSREKAIAYVNTALKHTSFAPDAKKKLLLRKAMLLCSLSRPSDAEISKTLTGAIGIESGNVELDIFNYGLKKLNFAPLASERKSSFGMKEWVAAAAVLLLLLLPLNLLKHQEPYSSASLSSLVTAVERMAQDPLETVTQETVLDSFTVASEMPDSLNLVQSEIALAEAEAPAPESVEQQYVAPQTVYHVIIASLSSQAKARQYMSEISEYNFDNLEIVRAENRYRVSVANFTSEDSAESFLADFKLRHEAFASAWVFAEKAD